MEIGFMNDIILAITKLNLLTWINNLVR